MSSNALLTGDGPQAQLYVETEMERSIENRIAEAAIDYKMALENEEFASENGGSDKLRDAFFTLVVEWESDFRDRG